MSVKEAKNFECDLKSFMFLIEKRATFFCEIDSKNEFNVDTDNEN